MTIFNESHSLYLAFKDWDKVRATADCLHCNGTGLAPGDGRTECGFCEPGPHRAALAEAHYVGMAAEAAKGR